MCVVVEKSTIYLIEYPHIFWVVKRKYWTNSTQMFYKHYRKLNYNNKKIQEQNAKYHY